MSKRGALKSKYSCAVHSDFYCFASVDICRHGHLATCVGHLRCVHIYSLTLTNAQRWSLNAPLMFRPTSFQYKWRQHRCTSADVFRHRSMSPFIAERCHSDKTWHRWASVDDGRRPMHSDEVWTHHYGAFRLTSFCIGRRLSTLVFCGTTRIMRTNIHTRAKLLWTTIIGRRWPMYSDEVWMQVNVCAHNTGSPTKD